MERFQYFNKEKEKFVTQNIVVKIGSSTITDGNGYLDIAFIDSIAKQASDLFLAGVKVAIVTSGAVECGRTRLAHFDGSIMSKRRAAARGQAILMKAWSNAFEKYGIETDQIIATEDNLNYCLELLKSINDGIPIINGNDAVNSFGQDQITTNNDMLAGFVAQARGADTLALFTDVAGILDINGKVVDIIYHDEDLSGKVIFNGTSKAGTGGMETKHLISKELALHDTNVFIANGREKDVLLRVARGEQVGTKYCKSAS